MWWACGAASVSGTDDRFLRKDNNVHRVPLAPPQRLPQHTRASKTSREDEQQVYPSRLADSAFLTRRYGRERLRSHRTPACARRASTGAATRDDAVACGEQLAAPCAILVHERCYADFQRNRGQGHAE